MANGFQLIRADGSTPSFRFGHDIDTYQTCMLEFVDAFAWSRQPQKPRCPDDLLNFARMSSRRPPRIVVRN